MFEVAKQQGAFQYFRVVDTQPLDFPLIPAKGTTEHEIWGLTMNILGDARLTSD